MLPFDRPFRLRVGHRRGASIRSAAGSLSVWDREANRTSRISAELLQVLQACRKDLSARRLEAYQSAKYDREDVERPRYAHDSGTFLKAVFSRQTRCVEGLTRWR